MVEGKVQIVLPGRKVVDERAPRPRNLLEFVSSWYGLFRARSLIFLCAKGPASYATSLTQHFTIRNSSLDRSDLATT